MWVLKVQSTDFNTIQLHRTQRHSFLLRQNKDCLILAMLFGKTEFTIHNRDWLDMA